MLPAFCSSFPLSRPDIHAEASNQAWGNPPLCPASPLILEERRDSHKGSRSNHSYFENPQKVQGSGTGWFLFFCSLCHPTNVFLCFLPQTEGEAKGTRHQKIAAGPGSYVRIWIRAFDRKGGDGCGHGAARKWAQSHKEDGNKELSLPTSLGQIRSYWGHQEHITGQPHSSKESGMECERKVSRM